MTNKSELDVKLAGPGVIHMTGKMTTLLERQHSFIPSQPFLDITGGVVQVESKGGVLWINVDGICVLRVSHMLKIEGVK